MREGMFYGDITEFSSSRIWPCWPKPLLKIYKGKTGGIAYNWKENLLTLLFPSRFTMISKKKDLKREFQDSEKYAKRASGSAVVSGTVIKKKPV